MPAYSYTALDDLGAKHKGILSAESEREARRLVKDLKLTPLKISASNDLSKTLKIKTKDILIMTRHLSTLLPLQQLLFLSLEMLLIMGYQTQITTVKMI